MLKIISALLLALISTPALAAPIYVTVDSSDKVGKLLAYQIRETIASSARHTLVNDRNDAIFSLEIVTLDADGLDVSTIYSLVLVWENEQYKELDYYISSWVGACGSERVRSCATNLASEVDAEMQPIIEAIAEFLNNEKKEDVTDFSDVGI